MLHGIGICMHIHIWYMVLLYVCIYMVYGIGICMHIYGIWYWYMYEYIWYGIGISMYGVWYWYIYGIMEYGKTWLGPMVSTMETEWE